MKQFSGNIGCEDNPKYIEIFPDLYERWYKGDIMSKIMIDRIINKC
jgi:hypothetical protein